MPEGFTVQRDAGPPGRPRQGPRPRPGHAAAAARQRPGALGLPARRVRPRARGSCSRRPTGSTTTPTRAPGARSRWWRSSTRRMAQLDVEPRRGGVQPHPLRDPDHGLADRGGDEGARGAGQGGPGDLQPAQAGHPAGHRRHLAATRRSWPVATASKIDFTSNSPYNTRKVKGLPPTPIASPGRASIEAALHPADGPWIYYVLRGRGRPPHSSPTAPASSPRPSSGATTPGSAAADDRRGRG